LRVGGCTRHPPALALSATVTGSWTYTSGSTIYQKDTGDDHLFTSGPYIYSGGGGEYSLVNKSGYNTTVQKTVGGTITSIKACRSKPIGGMTCSTWVG
jgi:hypothetical protein